MAAFIAANLPFINHRMMVVGPLAQTKKALIVRLVELVVLYFLVGGIVSRATYLRGGSPRKKIFRGSCAIRSCSARCALTSTFPKD